jgi:hypothetical protein
MSVHSFLMSGTVEVTSYIRGEQKKLQGLMWLDKTAATELELRKDNKNNYLNDTFRLHTYIINIT